MSALMVDENAAIERVAELWNRIAGAASSPIQQYIWSKACLETLNSRDRLFIVHSGDRSIAAALAPLILRSRGLPRLILPGSDELFEPMDVLYSDPESLDDLALQVFATGLPVWLQRVPSASATIEAFKNAYRGRGVVVCRPSSGAPTLPIDSSWSSPESHLNAGRRSDLRRLRRIADKMGTLEFEIHDVPPDAVEQLVDEALDVELKSWKGKERTALALDPRRAAFFKTYAAAAAAQGIFRILFMRIGGKTAAMQIAVEFGRALWLLKIGYDETFKRCSPGQLLMLEALRYAADRGLTSVEFLGHVEPWTRLWTEHSRDCISLKAYPASISGMAVLASDAAQSSLAKVQRRLRKAFVTS